MCNAYIEYFAHSFLRLKSLFGPFPPNTASETCSVVKNLCTLLPDYAIHELGNVKNDGK